MAESGRELVMKTTPIENDYIIEWNKKLGSGISGPVRLCTNRSSGKNYALKILLDSAKSKTEATVHYKCSGHSHIVSVIDVYANSICFPGELRGQTRILMVLELMQGGELFDLIRTKRRFTEKEAIIFTRQISSAVYHCHSFNVAHRDLKPENLLLKDKSDNIVIKLADFGFAKIDRGDLVTPQFTPYYVSPQVLEAQRIHRAQKSGRFPYLTKPYTYDKSCDMWSLGVIIYIMLCGYPPFYSEVPRKQLSQGMRRKIMAGDYNFPDHEWSKISPDAKDLITRLLRVEPAQRMAVGEVLDHPWLGGDDSEVDIDLCSPTIMANEEAFREAMTAHATQLTNMRLPDKIIKLKEIRRVKNPILEKRKQMLKSGNLEQCPVQQRPRSNSQAEKDEALKALRDIIAFCLMPPIPTSEEYCAEEELGSLVTKALQSNPDSQELKEALIKESWNGEAFLGSVDKKRLAKAVSKVVKRI